MVGCVESTPLVIARYQSVDSSCAISESTSGARPSNGLFDIGLTSSGLPGFNLVPLVQNNLPLRTVTMVPGQSPTVTNETDAIYVSGFDVELIPKSADIEAALP